MPRGLFDEIIFCEVQQVPRMVHETRIVAAKQRAYYGQFNENPEFIAARDEFLRRPWSASEAEAFVASWHLGTGAVKDLLWMHQQRQVTAKVHRLMPGPRSYPGVQRWHGDPRDNEPLENDEQIARLGYREYPPALNDGALRRGGRRLYERAVLQRSWQEIADAEAKRESRTTAIDFQAVKDGVGRYARELGVWLPQRLRGRPPQSAQN